MYKVFFKTTSGDFRSVQIRAINSYEAVDIASSQCVDFSDLVAVHKK